MASRGCIQLAGSGEMQPGPVAPWLPFALFGQAVHFTIPGKGRFSTLRERFPASSSSGQELLAAALHWGQPGAFGVLATGRGLQVLPQDVQIREHFFAM